MMLPRSSEKMPQGDGVEAIAKRDGQITVVGKDARGALRRAAHEGPEAREVAVGPTGSGLHFDGGYFLAVLDDEIHLVPPLLVPVG